MAEWLSQYWYALTGVTFGALYVAWQVRKDRTNKSTGKKIAYALLPALDPETDASRRLTPRAIVLVGVGLVLVMLANLIVHLTR